MGISYGMSFEEMVDIYGSFPLKENFMETGNTALEKLGLRAVQEGNVVSIHFLSKPYFNEYDYQQLKENGFEEADIDDFRRWTIEGTAYIKLGQNSGQSVTETGVDYEPDNYGDEDLDERFEDLLDRVYDEDDELGADAISTFLDAAVNAE